MDEFLLFLFKLGLVSVVMSFSGFIWMVVYQMWKGTF